MFNFIKKNRGNEEKQFYFGLILKEAEGVGLIIQLDLKNKSCIKVDEQVFSYSNSWENLIEDVDQVLYDLEKRQSTQVKKVIFFLYSHLIDQRNNQIKKPYLTIIKKIASELGLSASGFIEYHEAVSAYIQHTEEAPTTAIIVELDTAAVSVFIYKSGELSFSDSVGKTEDLSQDLESVFKKITGEIILPSRIIVFGSTLVSAQVQMLASHRWGKDLFIQIPRVEEFSQEQLMMALMHAFSAQYFNDNQASTTLDKEEKVNAIDAMGFAIGADINEVKTQSTLVSSFIANREKIMASLAAFKLPQLPQLSLPQNTFVPIIIGTTLISMAIFSGLFFFHKASITLLFKAREETKELTITKEQLFISKEQKIIEASDSRPTTGKKTIGQKASGVITIYNKDTAERSFKKGMILSTPANIAFLLDSDIKVASASESLTNEGNVLTVTGKTKANITARELGTAGNIAKGEKLTIEDFSPSVYFAVSESNFTGGTKEEVQTVSKEDMSVLREKVAEKMKNEKNKLLSSKKNTVHIIDSLTSVKISQENYSKELGEESSLLSLKAKGGVVFYTYKDEDIKKTILANFQKIVPESYQLSINNISYAIVDAQQSDDTISLKVAATARFIGKLDKQSFKSKIAGKLSKNIEPIAKGESAHGYKLKITAPVGILNSRVPFFTGNIEVNVQSL